MNTEEIRWKEYYETVKGRSPRDTLLKSLKMFEDEESELPKFAVDLGAGVGNDTRELISRGWKVFTYDKQAVAIAYIRNGISKSQEKQLETHVTSFEDISLPQNVTLINASYSIPFCSPQAFIDLWEKTTASLISGGRFSGQIFGNEDEWMGSPGMTFFTKSEMEKLFESYKIEDLNEINEDSVIASGEPKHWHVFHIVARKL